MHRPRFRSISLALAIALGVALAFATVGCSGTTETPSSGTSTTGGTATTGGTSANVVSEKDFAFNPSQLTVKVGDTVTFKNEDSLPHQVQIGTTRLKEQATGEEVTWTAEAAGTFEYFCTIHTTMKGVITVQ
jgi:plastocyanin